MGRNAISSAAGAAASRASYVCAIATILSLGVGIGIVASMGVTSGAGVAEASQEARQSALPLLVTAEVLKLVTGAAIALAVTACRRLLSTSALTAAIGYLGAGLVFGAGVLGLAALLGPAGAMLAWPVVVLGLASLPLTGSWAAMTASGAGAKGTIPAWLRWLAIVLGVLGFISVAFPPAAILFGLVSIAWWLLLGRELNRLPK